MAADYPLRPVFAALTAAEAAAGLLEDAAGIGTRSSWEARLAAFNCAIDGHDLSARQKTEYRSQFSKNNGASENSGCQTDIDLD